MSKKVVIGILAHVDAGKTTCIEAMLYQAGRIKELGRVDHKDATLDFDEQERNRGITIYSKEANLTWNNSDIYIIDTPGHIDFSSEMERSLQILDLAVVIINGQDGIQSHTKTIWQLLEKHNIPTIIFINKMDISHLDKKSLLEEINKQCGERCFDVDDDLDEKVALTSDELLKKYLETESLSDDDIRNSFQNRDFYPCIFGSALKMEGIEKLLNIIEKYSLNKTYPNEFGARVYKISHDDSGNRLTHMKITGGTLSTKQVVKDDEKVDQIRVYNGKSYDSVQTISAGSVCAVTGLKEVGSGEGLGFENDGPSQELQSFMAYELKCDDNSDLLKLINVCRQIAQEDPELKVNVDLNTNRIIFNLMGDMQKEVLATKIKQRSGIDVSFEVGEVVYKETIMEEVIGVGHFEPLRHYAEVVLKLEPLPRGAGLVIESQCSTDILNKQGQSAVINTLEQIKLKGVLTGLELTDIRIVLINGRTHPKHTQGQDISQATIRALRNGLMKGHSILLEPYESFRLEVPEDSLSKVLFDLESKKAQFSIEGNIISGYGPTRLLHGYASSILSLTKGQGKYESSFYRFEEVEDSQDIIDTIAYNPDEDIEYPSSSVFLSHGSQIIVPYDEVEDYMHIELESNSNGQSIQHNRYKLDTNELNRVIEMASGNNKRSDKEMVRQKRSELPESFKVEMSQDKPRVLIVDGYNVIYSWDSLKELADHDISIAREKLIDELFAYQAYLKHRVIIVFDGYKQKDNIGMEYKKGDDTYVVYTRSKQTADQYIEEITTNLTKQYNVIVATSDQLIQNSIFAHGAMRISSSELEKQINFHKGIY